MQQAEQDTLKEADRKENVQRGRKHFLSNPLAVGAGSRLPPLAVGAGRYDELVCLFRKPANEEDESEAQRLNATANEAAEIEKSGSMHKDNKLRASSKTSRTKMKREVQTNNDAAEKSERW